MKRELGVGGDKNLQEAALSADNRWTNSADDKGNSDTQQLCRNVPPGVD